jgi:hypothetical protein
LLDFWVFLPEIIKLRFPEFPRFLCVLVFRAFAFSALYASEEEAGAPREELFSLVKLMEMGGLERVRKVEEMLGLEGERGMEGVEGVEETRGMVGVVGDEREVGVVRDAREEEEGVGRELRLTTPNDVSLNEK